MLFCIFKTPLLCFGKPQLPIYACLSLWSWGKQFLLCSPPSLPPNTHTPGSRQGVAIFKLLKYKTSNLKSCLILQAWSPLVLRKYWKKFILFHHMVSFLWDGFYWLPFPCVWAIFSCFFVFLIYILFTLHILNNIMLQPRKSDFSSL